MGVSSVGEEEEGVRVPERDPMYISDSRISNPTVDVSIEKWNDTRLQWPPNTDVLNVPNVAVLPRILYL